MRSAPYTIDFETQSACDIKRAGAARYAADPTTRALCLAFGTHPEKVQLWRAGIDPAPDALFQHVASGRTVIAHNAGFEIAVWGALTSREGWPVLRIEQVDDTMARARAMSLPGGLAACAQALVLPEQKSQAGHKAMLKLSRPRSSRTPGAPLTFWTPETAPDDFKTLWEYCIQDVKTEMELHTLLPPLSRDERRMWELNEHINARGIPVDVPAILAGADLVEKEQDRAAQEAHAMTGCSPRQRDKMLAWLNAQGVDAKTLRKGDVAEWLRDPAIPDHVKEALACRADASKTSTAKLRAAADSVCPDGRIRGAFVYHGANTGRFSGRGFQPHNFKRPGKNFTLADATFIREAVHTPELVRGLYGSVLEPVSACLRNYISAAPGSEFLVGDFASIEPRVLAWVSGQTNVLDGYRANDAGTGPDLYKLAYSAAFGTPVSKVDAAQRQLGKVMTLALGYQGAIGSLVQFATAYEISLNPIAAVIRAAVPPEVWDAAEKTAPREGTKVRNALSLEVWTACRLIVNRWRDTHPAIGAFWRAAETAATDAANNPGTIADAGNIRFCQSGSRLLCRLPSGRDISYMYPEIKAFPSRKWENVKDDLLTQLRNAKETGDDIAIPELDKQIAKHEIDIEWQKSLTYYGVSSKSGASKAWKRIRTYGGMLTENIVQAVSRDILRDAMFACQDAAMPIAMHVHDEIVIETPKSFYNQDDLMKAMTARPPWLGDMPLAARVWTGDRYWKD